MLQGQRQGPPALRKVHSVLSPVHHHMLPFDAILPSLEDRSSDHDDRFRPTGIPVGPGRRHTVFRVEDVEQSFEDTDGSSSRSRVRTGPVIPFRTAASDTVPFSIEGPALWTVPGIHPLLEQHLGPADRTRLPFLLGRRLGLEHPCASVLLAEPDITWLFKIECGGRSVLELLTGAAFRTFLR